jgi:hypothetical protein
MQLSDDVTTKPTIETVLERINALADSMNAQFTGVNQRLDKMESSNAAALHKVARSIEVLSRDLLDVRAVLSMLEDRLEKLEARPS